MESKLGGNGGAPEMGGSLRTMCWNDNVFFCIKVSKYDYVCFNNPNMVIYLIGNN